MKLLTILSFQALVVALLCTSALAEKRGATLDEIIRALGSLYQKKLYSKRYEADELENSGGSIVGGKPVQPVPPDQGIREAVTIPRYHYCLKNIPYCVTFYGSLVFQGRPVQRSAPKRKNIRDANDQIRLYPKYCITNITLGVCSDTEKNRYPELIDVSNLVIPDFCIPGNMSMEGQVEVLERISKNTTVHIQINPNAGPHNDLPPNDYWSCSQVGYFHNVCDFVERDCTDPRPGQNMGRFPCSCEIERGVYDMHGFLKTIDNLEVFAGGLRSGYAVIFNDEGKSCFTFQFRPSFPDYARN